MKSSSPSPAASADKRILRSKASLQQAFLQQMLRLRIDPASITVVDLCRLAGVNRSTFYKHYLYIDLLAEEIIHQEVLRLCLDGAQSPSIPGQPAKLEADHGLDRQVVSAFMQRLEDSEIIHAFLRSENCFQYQKLILNELIRVTRYNTTPNPDYYTAYFQNAGAFSTILEWLAKGKNAPKQHILDIIHDYSKTLYPRR